MSSEAPVQELQALYARAISLHEQGELTRACELYEEVLDHVPDADIVLYNFGLALFAEGEFSRAEEILTRAVGSNSSDADYWFNLALARKELHLFGEAVAAYRRALAIRPDDIEILYSLGCCCKDSGATEEAIKVYRHLLELDNSYVPAMNNLAYLLHLKGELREAAAVYNKVLVEEPDHGSAWFMTKALAGEDTAAPPTEYVQDLFDQFAENFDHHLIDRLEYRLPEVFTEMLASDLGREQYDNCLDLGCGTGLCAELVRHRCLRLTGIDLSEGMVEQAAAKGIYDTLEQDDLVGYLKATGQCFNLMLAADVFIYFGDLKPIFRAMALRCAPGAHLLFSVELEEEGEWVLQPSGRYTHSRAYVRKTAQECGFSFVTSSVTPLRKENKKWIEGIVFFLAFGDQK